MPYETPEEREDREAAERRHTAQAYWAKKEAQVKPLFLSGVEMHQDTVEQITGQVNHRGECVVTDETAKTARRAAISSTDIIDGLNAAWTLAHSSQRVRVPPYLLTDAVHHITLLNRRADKAKQLLEDGAPRLAADALNGEYDITF